MTQARPDQRRRLWLREVVRPGQFAARLAASFLAAEGVGAILYAAALGGGAGSVVVSGPSRAPLWPWLLLGLAGACLRGSCAWGAGRAGAAGSASIRAALRLRLAQALLHRRVDAGGRRDDTGAAMTALADGVDSLDGYAARFVPARIAAVPAQGLILVAAAAASWCSALLLAATLIPFVAVMALAGGAAADEARAQFRALSGLAGLFADRIRKLPIVLAFGAEEREAARLGEAAAELHRRTMRVLRVAFVSSAGLEFFAALSVALVAVYCGFSLLGLLPFPAPEHLTLGRALFVLALAPEFFAPMRRLAAAYHDQQAAEAAADRMMALEGGQAPIRPAASAAFRAPPRIRFDGATVRYGGADRATLDAFDLDIAPGEMVALFGASGTGKSTAINLLLGLAPLVGGEVWIDEQPLTSLGDLAASSSWMGQASFLVAGDISDNIGLSWPEAAPGELRRVTREVGLAPGGTGDAEAVLERRLDERGGGLSGGERRRVTLARALLKPAPVLLLDEPTAHLDAPSERALIETIRTAAAGRTTIIATHSAALAAACDRIVELRST